MEIKYFDHSATTPVDKKVLEEMLPYFTTDFGNPSSVYSIGKKAKEVININRMKIANILGCKVNEIYFTSCGSESDNLILKGIAFGNRSKGNHIITSKIEHPAILNTCKFLEKFGFRISYINVDQNGIVDLRELENAINRNTILISIMYANNEIGTIEPIEMIAKIAKKYNVYFHTDAVQAVGNVDINVRNQNIGALSLSAHKFYGPKGVGLAYINENINFLRMQDGGHLEKDKRAGTENVAGIVGLGKALELAPASMEENNVKLNGDIKNRLPGNANISFSGVDGSKLLAELDKRGICASSGSACSAGLLNPSHVLLAIGATNNLAKSSLRISFGKENTFEETKYLVDNLEEIINDLRFR